MMENHLLCLLNPAPNVFLSSSLVLFSGVQRRTDDVVMFPSLGVSDHSSLLLRDDFLQLEMFSGQNMRNILVMYLLCR